MLLSGPHSLAPYFQGGKRGRGEPQPHPTSVGPPTSTTPTHPLLAPSCHRGKVPRGCSAQRNLSMTHKPQHCPPTPRPCADNPTNLGPSFLNKPSETFYLVLRRHRGFFVLPKCQLGAKTLSQRQGAGQPPKHPPPAGSPHNYCSSQPPLNSTQQPSLQQP